MQYNEFDKMLPDEAKVTKRTVRQIVAHITPEVQRDTQVLFARNMEASTGRNVRRRLDMSLYGHTEPPPEALQVEVHAVAPDDDEEVSDDE